jgi:calcineurin-like phosphoesterase family protein
LITGSSRTDHFRHKNIIKYSHRPFSSVEEHDECLIDNWNAHVKDNDNVYHLGDFFFGGQDYVKATLARLKGKIHFIYGNHDKSITCVKHMFVWARDTSFVNINGQQIWLSHYAHKIWPQAHKGAWHLYGHSHNTLPEDGGKSFDIGVDAVATRLAFPDAAGKGFVPTYGLLKKDYRPLHFDEVKLIMDKRVFTQLDHHNEETN